MWFSRLYIRISSDITFPRTRTTASCARSPTARRTTTRRRRVAERRSQWSPRTSQTSERWRSAASSTSLWGAGAPAARRISLWRRSSCSLEKKEEEPLQLGGKGGSVCGGAGGTRSTDASSSAPPPHPPMGRRRRSGTWRPCRESKDLMTSSLTRFRVITIKASINLCLHSSWTVFQLILIFFYLC